MSGGGGKGESREQGQEKRADPIIPTAEDRKEAVENSHLALHQKGLIAEKKRCSQPWRLALAISPLPL